MSAILLEESEVFLEVIVCGLIGFEVHDLSHESKVVQILDFLQSYLGGVIQFCSTAFLEFKMLDCNLEQQSHCNQVMLVQVHCCMLLFD